MNQPVTGLKKQIAFSLLVLLTLSGCRLVSSLSYVTPPPTPTTILTSTPDYCAWTWAYGGGSTEFDQTVTEKLADKGISATITSSSYGEVNSCGNTYSAMALDVTVEVKVDNLADQGFLAKTSEEILSVLKENLPFSKINNMGNIDLTFTTPDGSICYWDQSQQICAE